MTEEDKQIFTIEEFSCTLNAKRNKPRGLYRNEPSSASLPRKYTVEEVMHNVTSEINKMTSADRNNTKAVNLKWNKGKESAFLPLSSFTAQPTKANHQKYETQGVTDTQMLDVADGAEAMLQMISNKGMTQLFDMQMNNDDYPIDNNSILNDSNLSKKNSKTTLNNNNLILNEKHLIFNNSNTENVQYNTFTDIEKSSNKTLHIDALIETHVEDKAFSDIRNCVLDAEVLEECSSKLRSPSPVLKGRGSFTKPTSYGRKRKGCNLESFEEIGPPLNKMSKSQDCSVERILVETSPQCVQPKNYSIESRVRILEENIEDEIIFSSDEENCLQPAAQDLPLTLKTNETADSTPSMVLDKSMFVYFTTARNKFIQVSSDSLEKAKNNLSSFLEGNTDNDIELNYEEEFRQPELSNKFNLNKVNSEHKNISNINFVDEEEMYKYIDCDKLVRFNESQGNQHKGITIVNKPDNRQKHICNFGFSEFTSFDDEPFHGFETPNGKEINSAKEGLSKAIELINHDDNDVHNPFMSADFNNCFSIVREKEGICKNAMLDNDKNISVSEDNQSVKLEKIGNASEMPETCPLEKNNNQWQGLKRTRINESNIKPCDKTRKTLYDILDLPENVMDTSKNNTCFEIQGLKTASNKKILISKKAHDKTNNMFKNIEDSLYDVEVQSKNEPLLTDSNKIIHPTEDALANTRNILLCIDNDLKLKDIPSPSNFQGFTTASNKTINISEYALAKSKNLFDCIDNNTKLEDKPSHSIFQGFSTASNKTIQISEDALAKTKNLFDCIENSTKLEDKPSHSNFFQGFTTASNKTIQISEDALAKTKNLFDCVENNTKLEDKPSHSNFLQGFTTASNKTIQISEDALAKTKNLFDCVENNTKLEDKASYSKFQGFTTGSNKTIQISEDALAKTKNIFQSIENNAKLEDKQHSNFQGFTTANNKTIQISEDALAKTKNLFNCIENRTTLEDKMRCSNFQGFTTASNKNIQISEDSLSKTKNLFQSIDNETNFHIQDRQEVTTASKNTIINEPITFLRETSKQYSDRALPISKTCFEPAVKIDEKNLVSNYCHIQNETECRALTTACNNSIKVSEKAIEMSRNVFSDINSQIANNNEIGNTKRTFKGFTTGNNKPIRVSEEALTKTRQFFQEFSEVILSQVEETSTMSGSFAVVTNKTDEHKGNNENYEILPAPDLLNALTAENIKEQKVSEQTKHYKKLFQDMKNLDANEKTFGNKENRDINKQTTENRLQDDILNTQIKNDFEETLYTEDFCGQTKSSSPTQIKTPGSPILPCTVLAKRRKTSVFKVPYRMDSKIELSCDYLKKKNVKKRVLNLKNTFEFTKDYKKTADKRISLKYLKNAESSAVENTDIPKFNFNNTSEFKFDNQRNDVTSSELEIEDLKRIFLNSVDIKIVPEGWVENHIKLILWKLLSYEMFFPNSLAGATTAKSLLQQLKYRYDRELHKVERPVLRKILEKDEPPNRAMVLCVVRILVEGHEVASATKTENIELDVTDGWYCVRATIDKTLSKAVVDGKIVSGTKIITHGAEILNCEEGKAPWEDISAVRLKLSGNSSRRAAWHARLGARGGSAPPAALHDVAPAGGKVARLRAHVARVYPPLYVERLSDGGTVTRSERLEALRAAAHDAARQARLERLHDEVRAELEAEGEGEDGSQRSDGGREIITESQSYRLTAYTAKQRDRMIERIQRRIQEKIDNLDPGVLERNVVPLLKVRVCTWRDTPRKKNSLQGHNGELTTREEKGRRGTNAAGWEMTKACLSVWNPSEDLLDVLKEGEWIDAMNVVPTAVRMSELHISAGRQSIFSRPQRQDTEKLAYPTASVVRKCVAIEDLRNTTESAAFNEVDLVGLIFQIDPDTEEFDKKTTGRNFQNVYLTDSEKNFVSLNFWGGLKKFGFERVLEWGQFVACSNLQKRMGSSRNGVPELRVTELSSFTKVPRNQTARSALDELKKSFVDKDLDEFCRECLKKRTVASGYKDQHSKTMSPYAFNNMTDYNISKHKVFIDSPFGQKQPLALLREDDLNLSGLDFESTFKRDSQASEEEALRRTKVRSKIEKLKKYCEPPPLSAIHIINSSIKVDESFKSPIQGCNDALNRVDDGAMTPVDKTLNEDTDEKSRSFEKITCCTNQNSPLILRNNPCVRKSFVNPVRLNFDAVPNEPSVEASSDVESKMNKNNSEKDFSEEFEYSPPLSLDADFL